MSIIIGVKSSRTTPSGPPRLPPPLGTWLQLLVEGQAPLLFLLSDAMRSEPILSLEGQRVSRDPEAQRGRVTCLTQALWRRDLKLPL